MDSVEFAQAQVALTVCDNKNTREKLFKANADMWCNKNMKLIG